jgi:hypothetical protein
MFYNERVDEVRRLLFRYVDSPSLRHIRDPKSVNRLAEDIVQAIDREPTIWRKWEGQREVVLKAASACWVPVEDLRAFLNSMPGPKLTVTDVQQRLRAFHEEPYESYPNHRVSEGCLALYEREKAAGTELPAIIGALQEYVEAEEERLRKENEQAWRRRQEEERIALEQRFLAGADCKWTPIRGSREVFTRKNGRAYRLDPAKDKRWKLHRIENEADAGKLIGTYASRTDANKALAKLAFEPEPRW